MRDIGQRAEGRQSASWGMPVSQLRGISPGAWTKQGLRFAFLRIAMRRALSWAIGSMGTYVEVRGKAALIGGRLKCGSGCKDLTSRSCSRSAYRGLGLG